MCGIAGVFGYAARQADPTVLMRMSAVMQPRGPDGEGLWQSGDGLVQFAHRRLSIIDINARASQPMTTSDSRFSIVFNGEIYNYRALRSELEAQGTRFRTNSDTEVLLEMFRHFDLAALPRLRGMYAFAIWDSVHKRLTLARDPYGIKPLYYSNQGGELRFASQVKALLSSGVTGSLDSAGVVGFHLFGNVPEPFTFIDSIHGLPAGHYVTVTQRGVDEPRQFASISELFLSGDVPDGISEQDDEEVARAALQSSVASHLVADVPVGLFLSGGIDSAALLGLMRDAGAEKINTITLGFDEFVNQSLDERDLASQVARTYDSEHHFINVSDADFFYAAPAILSAMDQPTVDGVNTYFVSKAAHEIGLKVAMSGVGGDELFGGYSHFKTIPRDVAWMHFMGAASRSRSFANMRLPKKGWRWPIEPKIMALLRNGGSYAGSYFARRCVFTPHELPGVMDRDLASAGLAQLEPIMYIDAKLPLGEATDFERVAILESTIYLRNQLLRDADWAGMAHSLEIRVPLVDTVLLSELASVLRGRSSTDKKLLARAPLRAFPEEISERPKTGFATPMAGWLAKSAELGQWRDCAALRPATTKWAKRWAYVVSQSFVGDIR